MALRYRKSPRTGVTQALIHGHWQNFGAYLKKVKKKELPKARPVKEFVVYGVEEGATRDHYSVVDFKFYAPSSTRPQDVLNYIKEKVGKDVWKSGNRPIVAGRTVLRKGKARSYRAGVDRALMRRAYLEK